MAKRGNSEGSIYQRTDGRWVGVLHLGYEGGRRQRKSFYGRTRKEVAAKLTTATTDHNKGLPSISERQTVGQFLSRWREESAGPAIRSSTYEGHSAYVR